MHIHIEKDVLRKVHLIHGVPETLYHSNKEYGTLKAGIQQKTTNISWTFLLFLPAAVNKKGNSIFSQYHFEWKKKEKSSTPFVW